MEKYELVIALEGKVTPAKKKAVVSDIEKIITTFKGKVTKVNDWGEKELAYKIVKSETGYFIIFDLELDGSSVKGLNLKLKMEDNLLRYLLIKKDVKEEKKDGKKSK